MGGLESRTGTPAGWLSRTSTQLPDSFPLYDDLRQPFNVEASGIVGLLMVFVFLRDRPHEGQ